MPELTKSKLKSTRERLANAHCTTGKIHRQRSRKVRAGRVIRTTPKAGTTLDADSSIAVTISRDSGGRTRHH